MIKLNFRLWLVLCTAVGLFGNATAQCLPGEVELIVEIIPDSYPGETSWDVVSGTDTLMQGLAAGDTACVPVGECLTFTVHDSYGDGLCCAYGTGSYTVYLDGVPTVTGGTFSYSETSYVNCPPGSSCGTALVVAEGDWWAASADTWYEFSPDSTGTYAISTCDSNACDTKIWVYDYCAGLTWDETNQATIYYDDDNGGCDSLALVLAQMTPTETYWIRIGTADSSCADSIFWTLHYNGPIVGCTDPGACNYNPLATVTDTCLYAPDTLCPGGPDLMVVESAIVSSMYMDVEPVDPCYITEGCMAGYGVRDILRFTTWIKNIGDQDYYIGTPASSPAQFEWDACHGHFHYEGYAEYRLYDLVTGNMLPLSYKNGFCVMDLECSGGGTAQYGCSNMGISSGCGDIYSASLDCQWVDITDIPDGDYQLVVTVNWDWDADALGRYETNYMNNWGSVCFNLSRPGGVPDYTLLTGCTPVYDCDGIPFGNNVPDCAGDCGGSRLRGDLDVNLVQEVLDSEHYVDSIIDQTINPVTCNDLNVDGDITVYDAALVQRCGLDPSYCTFPDGIINITHNVELSIMNLNMGAGYLDIGILNPDNEVVAYEFNMSGIDITGVDNLISPSEYPITPSFNDFKVIGISHLDSLIGKNLVETPLCRIWFANPADTICIAQIVDVVNKDYEETVHSIANGCVYATGVDDYQYLADLDFTVVPNPSTGIFNVELDNELLSSGQLLVLDFRGRVVREIPLVQGTSGKIKVDLSDMEQGFYLFSLQTPYTVVNQRAVITK